MDEVAVLVAALVGVAGTLGGVHIAQRHADRSELVAATAQFLAELDAVALVVRRALAVGPWVPAVNG